MGIKKQYKYGIIAVVCLVAVWASRIVLREYGTVTSYIFVCDERFADTHKASLQSFVRDTDFFKYQSLSAAAACLKHKFPSISRIILSLDSTGCLLFDCRASTPSILFDKELVLTADGKIHNKSVFAQESLKTLPSVALPLFDLSLQQLPGSCITAMSSLHKELFDRFDIAWQSPTCCILHDKRDPRFSLWVDDTTLPTHKHRAAYDQIQTQLLLENKDRLSQKKRWCIDMRFANQMIVSQDEQGGV